MNCYRWIICCSALACMALLPAFALAADDPAAKEDSHRKPNIVMVLIDDMGFADLSCFGNTEASTPHIDRLATEGIRFSQFYVNAPICSPSRCALTTGQYPHRWRITSYLDNRAANQRRGVAQWLDPKAPALARFLKEAGYATGHFGKWHLGGQRDVGDAPLITEYGFEESLTNFEGLGPRLLGLGNAHDGKPPARIALRSDTLGQGPVIWQDRSQLTAGYVGAAIAFVNKAAAEERPFYINVWPDDVHSPYYPPQDKRGDGSKRALYLGVLETMDAQLGALFEHIRNQPELRDNTLVLLCSDNGHEPGGGSAGKLRGSKAKLYEGGIRSPLIVWGPALVAQDKVGSHNDTSVFAAFDLVPSMLELSGAHAPEGTSFDGENMLPTLLGRESGSRQAPIFWRRPPDRKAWPPQSPQRQPDLAVRDGQWKLLCEYDGSKPKLFDLLQDPYEANNIEAQHPEITARLTEQLVQWHRSMPPDNGPALAKSPPKL